MLKSPIVSVDLSISSHDSQFLLYFLEPVLLEAYQFGIFL